MPSAASDIQTQPETPEGLSRLASRYDVLFCDLWGVVHDGTRAFQPAIAALSRFRGKGGTVVLLTNAPQPRGPVETRLNGMGITAESYDGIVTSGDVTVAAIAAWIDQPFHHIGPPRDRALFDVVRHVAGREPVLVGLDDAAFVVVSGLFDDERESAADYAPSLASMRRRDLPMICANPDVVVHVGDRVTYCGGALAEAYAASGGRVILAGKPHPPIYAAALAMAAEVRGGPVDRARVLAIGDGLLTDIAGATAQGLDALFISSGIHRDDFHPHPASAVRDGPAGYAERLARIAHRPLAALPRLCW